jgi:ATP-dependent Lon protease
VLEIEAGDPRPRASAHWHPWRRDEGIGECGVERARARRVDRSRVSSHRDAFAWPEGATPKDGPSAGGAIVTAIVSILTGIPVRADVAMTGEITLRGRVLAIGGLKEKAVAAHRNAVRHVLIPHQNMRDLEELPQEVRSGITFHPVKTMDDVLALALVHVDFAADVPAVAPH